MRILFVAPEISTPYSEGRKRFVLDLCTELKKSDDVLLLTTTKKGQTTTASVAVSTCEVGHSVLHLFNLIWHLPKAISDFKPDLVCVFPYGSFRHLYGAASRIFMRLINHICHKNSVPCQTIMYSIDGTSSPKPLRKYASNLILSQYADWDGPVVNIGLDCCNWPDFSPKVDGSSKLLFMAGMWEQSKARAEHVIQVRGLGVLLQAGKYLAPEGVKLLIAIPLLSSPTLREYILTHPLNTWPHDSIELQDLAKTPDIYRQADLFLFPYQHDITQFTPTSVLEAMLSGVAVAISDKQFLTPLAQQGSTAYTFPADDPKTMSSVILNALQDPQTREGKIRQAQEYIRKYWSIEHSAEQIRAIAHGLS